MYYKKLYKIKRINIIYISYRYLYFNTEEEEEFYKSLEDKIWYSSLTNKGIHKRIFFKEYKKNFKLNIEQKEALIGIMLGDGYLERNKSTHNARLHLEQSYPEKEDYLLSLFELYKPLVTNYPKIIIRKPDIRTGKIYKSIAFKTSAFNCFNEYHDLFYENKIKIVPKNIQKLLTARGLAYWIMDDGGKSKSNQMVLHTRAFSKKEVILLQNALKVNFKLNSRLEEKEKNQWVIFIPVKQEIPLTEIVKPYMHKSMLYKINKKNK
jgi:hypothetical protein